MLHIFFTNAFIISTNKFVQAIDEYKVKVFCLLI